MREDIFANSVESSLVLILNLPSQEALKQRFKGLGHAELLLENSSLKQGKVFHIAIMCAQILQADRRLLQSQK